MSMWINIATGYGIVAIRTTAGSLGYAWVERCLRDMTIQTYITKSSVKTQRTPLTGGYA